MAYTMITSRKIWKGLYGLLLCSFIGGMTMGIYIISKDSNEGTSYNRKAPEWLDTKINQDKDRYGVGGSQLLQKIRPNSLLETLQGKDKTMGHLPINNKVYNDEVKEVFNTTIHTSLNNTYKVDYNVHVFYYMWYGNPDFDKKYLHWNHKRIPHWNKAEAIKWPTNAHVPPDDIGANFYPDLGPYSSQDPAVIENHMQQIQRSGAGVLAVSWYPPDVSDDNGQPWDQYITLLMDIAHKYQLKICFHIEPYNNRSAKTMKFWIQYIIEQYGEHPAFYRYKSRGKHFPVYYIYDSYQVKPEEWAKLFHNDGALSVRNTPLDGIYIALLVESKEKVDIQKGGFDGFYSYFASTGFTYGSSPSSWNMISREAKKNNMMFIPSIGPGYIDDRVRPWNKRNTKSRDNGKYYEHMFQLAIECNPPIVSITSFNEWHEGTQIERAVPKTVGEYKYLDYSPNEPDFYLNLTRKWVGKFMELKNLN